MKKICLLVFLFLSFSNFAKAEANPFSFLWDSKDCIGSGYDECMAKKIQQNVEIEQAINLKIDAAQKQKLAGAINTPMTKLKEAAQPIGEKLNTYATSLFWILVLITGAYQFAFMVLKRSDLGEYFAEVVKFTITIGFFYWLLKNGTDIGMAIFDGFSV